MKIAVICAFPVGSNPGMLTVDLAVETLRVRLPNTVQIDRFCAWRGFDKQGLMVMEYQMYNDTKQLDCYDKIIFWGDFLHWRGYAMKDFLRRGRGKIENSSDQTIIDQWYQLYLLEDRPDLQRKSLAVGGSLYGMNSEDMRDLRYQSAICQLYSNMQISLMRDLISSNFVSQITGNNYSNFGCDCAALLEVDHLIQSNDHSAEPYIAFSLGRSGYFTETIEFIHGVGKRMACNVIDINWLSKGTGVDDTISKIQLIHNAKAVVTDIYHCAITAWRQRTPVLCIGQGANRVTSTLSDKKKEIFHTQIFSLQNYIYLEEILTSTNNDIISLACERLLDTSANNFGSDILHDQKKHVLSKIIDTLLS